MLHLSWMPAIFHRTMGRIWPLYSCHSLFPFTIRVFWKSRWNATHSRGPIKMHIVVQKKHDPRMRGNLLLVQKSSISYLLQSMSSACQTEFRLSIVDLCSLFASSIISLLLFCMKGIIRNCQWDRMKYEMPMATKNIVHLCTKSYFRIFLFIVPSDFPPNLFDIPWL